MHQTAPHAQPHVTIVFPYYDNPEMLRLQLGVFERYSQEARNQCEVVIVDDCSPVVPAREVLKGFELPNVRLFRVAVNRPWNQDAARNIGAHEARGRCLLLTDIDHVVPEDTLLQLIDIEDFTTVYTFSRKTHFSDKSIRSHVNSYFMSKSLYWAIGGYDEDFWGTYGSDRLFRKRILQYSVIRELSGSQLELVTKGSIADAKNTSFPRRPSLLRRIRSLILRLLKRLGLRKSPVILSNPYQSEYFGRGTTVR